MKNEELRALSKEELNQKLSGFKKELFNLRMEAAAGKLDKSHRVAATRKDVARVMTLLKESGQKKGLK